VSTTTTTKHPRTGLSVVALCFTTVVFDGYDLIVYGSVLPSLLTDKEWDLTPAQAGAIGSYALAGMLLGALGAGTLTDRLGRRRIILIGITWFSLAMGLCAVAPTAGSFGLLRFVAGLGLGGVLPSAIALTVEFAPPDRRLFFNALMFVGQPVGGVLAAVLSLALLQDHGWRLLMALGAAPLVLVLPLAWKYLPESVAHLQARGRTAEAVATARRYGLPEPQPEARPEPVDRHAPQAGTLPTSTGFRTLFTEPFRRSTITFGLASFCGLLLVYGLNTWLPQIMREAGYPLGSALTFLLVLNLGAVVGALAASRLADRLGPRPVTVASFVVATVSLLLLSQRIGTGALLAVVALAGLGSVGTQILINGFVAVHHPAALRATALGWSLGLGRAGAITGPLFAAWVVSSGLGFEWNFYGFAVPALAGAVLIALVPRGPTSVDVRSGTDADVLPH